MDELRALRDESRRHTASLQARYAEETGITGLKIKHNNVLGYFIEVTPTHADKMAKDLPESVRQQFIHRQTLASAARYTTTELGDLEGKISNAADRALALEQSMFDKLSAQTLDRSRATGDAAAALAALAHPPEGCLHRAAPRAAARPAHARGRRGAVRLAEAPRRAARALRRVARDAAGEPRLAVQRAFGAVGDSAH